MSILSRLPYRVQFRENWTYCQKYVQLCQLDAINPAA